MRRIPNKQLEESWQLIEPDGLRLMRGEGGIALLEHIAFTRPLGKLCRILRSAKLIDLIDRVIYRFKPRLSMLVPDKPGPRRPPKAVDDSNNVPVDPRL